MKKAVIGTVQTRTQAETVVDRLTGAGFLLRDISLLLPDQAGARDVAHVQSTKAPEGAVAGAGAGGLLGGTLGLLAGIGAIAFPGIGALVAAGPLLAALSAAAAGAVVGGIAGSLVGMGIPEVEAKFYEGKLRDGSLLIAVHVESSDEHKRAAEALNEAGTEHVSLARETAVPNARQQPLEPRR
jgi:hypothetical protein